MGAGILGATKANKMIRYKIQITDHEAFDKAEITDVEVSANSGTRDNSGKLTSIEGDMIIYYSNVSRKEVKNITGQSGVNDYAELGLIIIEIEDETYTNDDKFNLAYMFCETIYREIGDDLYDCAGTTTEGPCKTHEYCDSNVIMDKAFQAITGKEFCKKNEKHVELVRLAWALARLNDYYVADIPSQDEEDELSSQFGE